MNFIGGNNYLSDPDSDAELASMTGGDDSSFYPDSEAGSESVYSGGMELSDYELDSQCGGDTDAAILQMGGYQSDENVVVPTVAEQKGGMVVEESKGENSAEAASASAAAAVAAAQINDGEKKVHKDPSVNVHALPDEVINDPQQQTSEAKHNQGHHDEESNLSNNRSKSIQDTKKDIVEKMFNHATFTATLNSINDPNQFALLTREQIYELAMFKGDEFNKTENSEKYPDKKYVDDFIKGKINQHLKESTNEGAQGVALESLDKIDDFFKEIIKCKVLSFITLTGTPVAGKVTFEFNKNENGYEYIIEE